MVTGEEQITTLRSWSPNWCVHPGALLQDLLDDRGWSQADLVSFTGFTAKHVNTIIKEHSGIGVKFALALERVTGVTAQYWMNLQSAWEIAEERSHGNW